MILTDVYVPSVDKTYDFNLNEQVRVQVIIEEIVEMIGQKEHAALQGKIEDILLCDKGGQCVLDRNKTLEDNGIHNGCSLILV